MWQDFVEWATYESPLWVRRHFKVRTSVVSRVVVHTYYFCGVRVMTDNH